MKHINCCIIPHLMYFLFIASCSSSSSKNIDLTISKQAQTSFYVSPNGSDMNLGTKVAPILHISSALSKTSPGDTVIVRAGDYAEKLTFLRSGTIDKPIVVMAYPGEIPMLDGSTLSITGQDAMVKIKAVNNIIVEGFDIANYKTNASDVDINGIIISDGANNIKIKNNKIYNIENNASPEHGRSGHGILIIGNTSVEVKNILIDNNVIHDCNTGYSENLTINGFVDGFTISNNKVYNGENIGIDAAGGYAANATAANNYARNGLITGNEVYNIDGTTGPIPAYANGQHGAIGIYIDGARNITVQGNKVHESDRGIGIVSETNGFPTQDCIIRNNFVYNCYLYGIGLGGYLNYTSGGTHNCYVLNNTLFQNDKLLGYYQEIEGEIRLTENCFDNIIENNLIYARDKDLFIHKYTTTGANNNLNNNLYFTAGQSSWVWNGTACPDFASWKTACLGDNNALNEVDPLLKNVLLPDLHISNTSPVIAKGVILQNGLNGATDIDGNPRISGSSICIGAVEIP